MSLEILTDFCQYDARWVQERSGMITASEADCIVTPAKFDPVKTTAAGRQKYLATLHADRWRGPSITAFQDARQTFAMTQGSEREGSIRDKLNAEYGLDEDIIVPGLCVDRESGIACSPDGLQPGLKRGYEIKAPQPTAQVMYLDDWRCGLGIPPAYRPQIMFSLYVTGYTEWVFVSYCPGLPRLLEIVKRDEELIATIDVAVKQFNKELSAIWAGWLEKGWKPVDWRAKVVEGAPRTLAEADVNERPDLWK